MKFFQMDFVFHCDWKKYKNSINNHFSIQWQAFQKIMFYKYIGINGQGNLRSLQSYKKTSRKREYKLFFPMSRNYLKEPVLKII